MKLNNKTNRIVRFFFLVLFVGVLTFLVPMSIGLGAGGFSASEVLQEFGFYQIGLGFLFLIVIAFLIEMFIRKGDEKYGNSIAFSSQGESPAVPFFKRFSQFQLFLFSVIIFGIIGLAVTAVRQTSFIGFRVLEQQFTPVGELFFSSLLIPGAENLGMALVIAVTIVGLRAWARKKNLDKSSFIVLWFLIVFIAMAYWGINHLLRYSGLGYEIGAVLVFGFIMGLLTLITGSFIPAVVLHASNNLFFDMQRMFARDNVVLWTIAVLVFLTISYVLIYRKKLFGKKVEG